MESCFGGVDHEPRANRHGYNGPANWKLPHFRIHEAREGDAVMGGKVPRCFGAASAGEVAGARTRHPTEGSDLPCDQAAVRHRPEPDSPIDHPLLPLTDAAPCPTPHHTPLASPT